MFKRIASIQLGLLACLCLFPIHDAYSQFTRSGEIEQRTVIGGITCKHGSIYFDGKCRKKKFFKRLVPKTVNLIDVYGCGEYQGIDDEVCGKTVTIVERINEVQTRTVLLTSLSPIPKKGVGSKKGAKLPIAGKSPLQNVTVPGQNTLVKQEPTTRGRYRVVLSETETAKTEGKSYALESFARYYDVTSTLVATEDRNLVFSEPLNATNAFDYTVSGSVCTDPIVDLERSEGDPTCSCLEEGNCLNRFKLDGRTDSVGNGTELACTEEGCTVCSSSSASNPKGGWLATETNFTLRKVMETEGGATVTSNSGLELTGLKKTWKGCWNVKGYYQGLLLAGESDDSTTCGPQIANVVEGVSTACEIFAGAGHFFYNTLSQGASLGLGIATNPFSPSTTGNLSTMMNSYPDHLLYKSLVNGQVTANGFCGTKTALQDITLEESFCESVMHFGSCNGKVENVLIAFTNPDTGQRCTGKTDLICTSTDGNPNTSINSAECNCTLSEDSKVIVEQCEG